MNLLDHNSPLRNLLLAALPTDSYELLVPHLTTAQYAQGDVLVDVGEPADFVYFPHDGMLSLLTVMRDGKVMETATIGRESVVCCMAGWKPYRSLVRVTVQLPLTCSRIASAQFRKLVAANADLRNLCVDSNEIMLTQSRVMSACNALHPVEPRLCRWLLQSMDRAEGNVIRLTQELLAEMLGVRRTSVTEVASKLQADGIITYSRGVITIRDRARLERASCECYETLIENGATLVLKS